MGKIITLSGPRGVGKTEVMKALTQKHNIEPIVPYATRDMREGEIDGEDYRFISLTEFDQLHQDTPMFDVLELRGNKYGTPLADFENALLDGDPDRIRSVNLAATSAINLRRRLGSDAMRALFLLPECWGDIEAQMRASGISESEIKKRCGSEPTDFSLLPEFDQIILNKYGHPHATTEAVANYTRRAFECYETSETSPILVASMK